VDFEELGALPDFAEALRARGFSELTEVQRAVLAPELANRDLRISSQTGSGKTIAIGFVVATAFDEKAESAVDTGSVGAKRTARPRVLVVVPTRELAAQLGHELSWLYGRRHLGLTVVTGGTAIIGDLRALSEGPAIVIGTPGRLVDHLNRRSLDLSEASEVVLDEADEMLDMGFREELDNILERTPDRRRTHLVSATFPPKVRALADRCQRDAVLVEGTVGTRHQDISHSAIVVAADQRTDILINLMLLQPDHRFLVFVRTRVAAAGVAGELASLGLSAGPLSGEMAQRDRTRCLADFRARKLQCVVATDVAARGLDIRGVQKIVHYDLPESREAFTHRSGRTGRAGEKGESILLVPPHMRRRVEELFRIVKADAQWRSPPTPAKIRKAGRKRLIRKFGAFDLESAGDPASSSASEEYQQIAARLLERRPPEALVAELLQELSAGSAVEPREIRAVTYPPPRHQDRKAGHRSEKGSFGGRPQRAEEGFVPFDVSWGFKAGANPKRILAHTCRRGGINGKQVGAINIGAWRSVVNISTDVCDAFERAVAARDPQNPEVRFTKGRS